jgi:hypothetical protein
MDPVSWCEMKCPKTLTIEHRKNAKVQSRYIQNNARKMAISRYLAINLYICI